MTTLLSVRDLMSMSRSAGNGSEGSHEVVIERQRRNQEAIADEMMGLARSLKENAIAAKDIITRDNKVPPYRVNSSLGALYLEIPYTYRH